MESYPYPKDRPMPASLSPETLRETTAFVIILTVISWAFVSVMTAAGIYLGSANPWPYAIHGLWLALLLTGTWKSLFFSDAPNTQPRIHSRLGLLGVTFGTGALTILIFSGQLTPGQFLGNMALIGSITPLLWLPKTLLPSWTIVGWVMALLIWMGVLL